MLKQLQEVSQLQANWADPGSVAPNPNCLELARQLIEPFSIYTTPAICGEPESGVISFQWPKHGIFLYVELNLTLAYYEYSGADIIPNIIIFCFPEEFPNLLNLLDKKLPNSFESWEKEKLT